MSETVDMKLEVVVIPVADVDRAKRFYGGLGWRLDADFVVGDEFRGVQFTPPGSPCSIHFGKGVTSAAPGSASGLYLVVSDIEAARAELVDRGVDVSEVFHRAGPGQPARPRAASGAEQLLVVRFVQRSGRQQLAAPGDHRATCPDAWTRTRPRSARRPTWRKRCGARRPRTASTRSGSANTTRTGRTGTPSTWCGSSRAKHCRHERLRRHRDRRRPVPGRRALEGISTKTRIV